MESGYRAVSYTHLDVYKRQFKTYEDLLKVPDLDAKLLEEQKKNILF